MKRKVIKLADTTYVVSIPLKWARSKNLEKGDEVEVELSDNQMSIIVGQNKEKNEVSVDVDNLVNVTDRYITALYRKAFDEIEITYSSPKIFSAIQSCLSTQTIGLEIVKQSDKRCVIADLTGNKSEEFDKVLRRMWFLVLDIANDTKKSLEKKDGESLKNMFYRDRDINKLSNYCVRAVLAGSMSRYQSIVYFRFIRNFEEICDEYKDMALYFSENKPELSEFFLKDLSKANSFLEKFHDFFYDYSDEKFEELIVETREFYKVIEQRMTKQNINPVMYHRIYSAVERIRDLLSTVFEIQKVSQLKEL